MTAIYNFKQMFVAPIMAGAKRQTIRTPRKREAKPGEKLRLQHGSRYQPKLIGFSECEGPVSVCILFEQGWIYIADKIVPDFSPKCLGLASIRTIRGSTDLDKFAREDGFDGFSHMWNFWCGVHGAAVSVFSGTLTTWKYPLLGGGGEA